MLNASALLSAWEQGQSQQPLQRALTLLGTAWSGTSFDDWARCSIGQRDAYLLSLREELFGDSLEAIATCPQCGQQLELSFNTEDVRVDTATLPANDADQRLVTEGYEISYRLPNSADLIEIVQHPENSKSNMLLQHCVHEARNGDRATVTADLPDTVVEAVIAEMAKIDPQADIQIALTCPACQHEWQLFFDIFSYLWSEIDDWAQRLLRDIHILASTYGWNEKDILSLSAWRRRIYLEMIES